MMMKTMMTTKVVMTTAPVYPTTTVTTTTTSKSCCWNTTTKSSSRSSRRRSGSSCCRSTTKTLPHTNTSSKSSSVLMLMNASSKKTTRLARRTRTTTLSTTTTTMMMMIPQILEFLFFFFFLLAISSSSSHPPFGLSFITKGGLFVNGEVQQQQQQQQQQSHDRPNPLLQLEPFAIPPPQYNSNSSSFDLSTPTTFRQNVCNIQQKLNDGEINELGTALKGLELRVIINENQYFQLLEQEGEEDSRHIPTDGESYPGLMVVILDELSKRGQFTWRDTFATYNKTKLLSTERENNSNKTSWDDNIDDLLLYWSTQTYDLVVDNWILSTHRMNKYHISFVESWYDATPILVGKGSNSIEEEEGEVLLLDSQQQQSEEEEEEESNSGNNNSNKSSFDILAFGKPFSASVWFCMVATIIFSGLVYMFLHYVDPYSDTRGSKLNYQPIENMYLTALGFTGHMEFQPRTHPARLFTLSIAFWALLMAASYTANLANFLIAGDLSSPSSSSSSSSTTTSSSSTTIQSSSAEIVVDAKQLLEQAMIGNGNNNKSICLLDDGSSSSLSSIKDGLLREYPNLNITTMTNEVDIYDDDDCVGTISYESSWTNYWKHQSNINGGNCSYKKSYGSVRQLLTTPSSAATQAAGGFATTSDSGILCTSLIHDVINLHMMEMKYDGFLYHAWEEFIENTKTNDCTVSEEEQDEEEDESATTSGSNNRRRRRRRSMLSHSTTATAPSSSKNNVDGGCTASSIESSSLSSTTTSINNNNNIRRRRNLKGINKRTGGDASSSQQQASSGTSSSTAIQLDLNNMGGIFILHLFVSVFAMAFALVHRWTGLTARRNKELREKNLRLQLKRMAANRKLSLAQSVGDRKRGIQEMLTLKDEPDDCPGFLFENNNNNSSNNAGGGGGGNNGSNPMRGRRLGGRLSLGRLSLGRRESNADDNNNNNNAVGGVGRGGSSASIDIMAANGGTTDNSSRDENFSLDQSIQALLNAIGNNKDTMWEDNFDNIHLQQDHQLDAIVDLQQQIDVSNRKQDEQTKAMLEMKDQLTTMMNMMMMKTTTTTTTMMNNSVDDDSSSEEESTTNNKQ